MSLRDRARKAAEEQKRQQAAELEARRRAQDEERRQLRAKVAEEARAYVRKVLDEETSPGDWVAQYGEHGQACAIDHVETDLDGVTVKWAQGKLTAYGIVIKSLADFDRAVRQQEQERGQRRARMAEEARAYVRKVLGKETSQGDWKLSWVARHGPSGPAHRIYHVETDLDGVTVKWANGKLTAYRIVISSRADFDEAVRRSKTERRG
jgi:hypothetical protein